MRFPSMAATKSKVKVVIPLLHPQYLDWGEVVPSLHFLDESGDLQVHQVMRPMHM